MACYAFILWLDEPVADVDTQFRYYHSDAIWELIDLYYNTIGQYRDDQ
jgi:hypothetical protein